MAREDIAELYGELSRTEFVFMPRGIFPLFSIYREVRSKFPELCDDEFLCVENCSYGNDDPEWHHAVRKALDALRRRAKSKSVVHVRQGYWAFR